jgi:two-component system, NarL family, response regulator LiaR
MDRFPATNTNSRFPRVLIVDDMPQVREDLGLLLQLTNQMEVVGEAANGLEAVQQAEVLHPDVVVIDLVMPEMDGCQATRLIKERGLAGKVIMLSIHADSDFIENSLKAGADAYIQKGAELSILIRAITDP